MSINVHYLRHLPIENFLVNTIPLAILLLGLAEFFLFHVTLDWGRKICDFFTGSTNTSNSKSQLGFSNKLKASDEKAKIRDCSKQRSCGVEKIYRDEVENIVLKSLGIVCQPDDGKLDQERFDSDVLVRIFEENKPGLDEVKQAFDVFDENKDGFVDETELQSVLLALGLKEGLEIENCRKMIRVYDENKDGRIDFDEFVNFMESIDL